MSGDIYNNVRKSMDRIGDLENEFEDLRYTIEDLTYDLKELIKEVEGLKQQSNVSTEISKTLSACPNCGSKNLFYSDYIFDNFNNCHIDIQCNDCNAQYKERCEIVCKSISIEK